MKISIITASYNYAQYLEEAVNSVINQSYQDWELIIVDDGSSDNSIEIIKYYCQKDSRIKFFQHPNGENKGLKQTLLLGLENITGDWVAFLESDDYFSDNYLEKKIEIIKRYPDVKLIFNKVEFLCADKNLKMTRKKLEKRQKKLSKQSASGQFPKNMFYEFYIDNMILTFSCVMVESETIKNADFNTPVDTLLDWWLWVHLAYKNAFYYIDEELTSWRLHKTSYIHEGKKPILYLVQMKAYDEIYKNSERELKFLIFICCSRVKIIIIRFFRFITKPIGLARNLLRDIYRHFKGEN